MTSLRELERHLEDSRESMREAERAVAEAQRRRRIPCNSCGKRTTVGKTTYVQTYYYVEPYSCTGGDYWARGETQFLCPHCGVYNRLIYRPEIAKLEPYFAKVEDYHNPPSDLYGSRSARRTVN